MRYNPIPHRTPTITPKTIHAIFLFMSFSLLKYRQNLGFIRKRKFCHVIYKIKGIPLHYSVSNHQSIQSQKILGSDHPCTNSEVACTLPVPVFLTAPSYILWSDGLDSAAVVLCLNPVPLFLSVISTQPSHTKSKPFPHSHMQLNMVLFLSASTV